MGSGSLATMAVFETSWRPNVEVMFCPCVTAMMLIALQRDEALALVTRAVSAGIFNDLGSGSNVDACVNRCVTHPNAPKLRQVQ